jgi:hypothetical protein
MGRVALTEVAPLADLLHETSERHASFESVASPHNWWDWYAAYMAARASGDGEQAASAVARRYMAEVKNVLVKDSGGGDHHDR